MPEAGYDELTCALGDAWFAPDERPPVARVDGREVGFDEAVEAAAAILRQARAPLVYGLEPDELRGAAPGGGARRGVRRRDRFRRGAVRVPGDRVQHGHLRRDPRPRRAGRRLAGGPRRHPPAVARPPARAVARRRRFHAYATAEQADAFIALDDDFEALWELRARVTGSPLRDGSPALEDLARRLLEARHVAFVYGSLDELTTLALFSLVRDLNRDRHAVTLALRDGNARGAEDVAGLADRLHGIGELRARPSARGPRRRRPAGARRRRCRARAGVRSLPAGDARAADGGRGRPPRRWRRGWRSPRPPTASRCPVPSTGWTACRSRCARRGPRSDRVSRTCSRRSKGAPDAPDRRRARVRPRERDRRRGARRLRAGRQDRRRRAVARPPHRRARDGRHARRRRHPRPHRRARRSTPRASSCPKSIAPTRSTAPRSRAPAPAGRSRRRSPPATATRCWATRPSSRPPRRRSRPATRSPSCATRRSSTPPSSC